MNFSIKDLMTLYNLLNNFSIDRIIELLKNSTMIEDSENILLMSL